MTETWRQDNHDDGGTSIYSISKSWSTFLTLNQAVRRGGYENPGGGNKEPDHREYLLLRQYLLSEYIYLSILSIPVSIYTCMLDQFFL